MISEYEMQSFWNSEIGKEIEKDEIKSSVNEQWKEIERLNELSILLMSKR
jgi:hypothetical protein